MWVTLDSQGNPIIAKMWTDSNGVVHIRGLMMEGPATFAAAPPSHKLDFSPYGYAYDSVNIDGKYTRETMTSYQGARTGADVKAGHYCGIWKICAASHSPDGITSYYTVDEIGVAGVVKGFVMHFTCAVSPDPSDPNISLGLGSGWYLTH